VRPSEILLVARELVAAGDCRHRLAEDERGRPVSPSDPRAVAWCTVGAVSKAAGGDERGFRQALDLIAPSGRADLHNGSTHLENVVRLEKAALLALSEGR
jgi:hypothetical protein